MNVRIVTASAGTGKTTHLVRLLDHAVSDASVRPAAILATTFTKQAAAELLKRARTLLLRHNRSKEAQALLTARIGTVNAVCGSLVTEFSLELGLSPELRVLDEAGAELALKRALSSIVTDDLSDRLQAFRGKFDASFDWQYEARRLIEAARANGLDAKRLGASADRSVASLEACLGPITGTAAALDAELHSAIDHALVAIAAGGVDTKGTQKYCDFLTSCRRDLDRRRLRWGDWANLCTNVPTKRSLAHAGPVRTVAAQHLGHPRLREELYELIRLMFDVATRGLCAYQRLKQEHGLLDFVDQEVFALALLSRPAVRDVLKDEIDLLLVDEFQDTSPLQLAIFLKLAELARQSVWVGDPKQAIYGFRGTDPALMDAAIESLPSPSYDPDLVGAVVDAVMRQSPAKTLSRSYRSRPALVDLTNAIFSRAFSQQQGMAEERVKVKPVRTDSPDLGPAVSHWPLSDQGRMNGDLLAQAVAAGARDLLGTGPTVWDRHTGSQCRAKAGDLAILCRTNDLCRHVSEALGKLGIASVVARVGLRESAEAQVLLAGLRLWVDARDRLAAATVVRILDYPKDAAGFVEKAVSPDVHERPAVSTAIQDLFAARERAQDRAVLTALDAVIDVLALRELCAAWGEQAQRIANLDAMRAHASRYCEERGVGGDAPSLVGFLTYFEDLATDGDWGKARGDTIARVGFEDAITVSTWHAAKGLEWPIVILFGLESVRDPEAYGVHVISDRTTSFDLSDPLGGRWIHFWPNPYSTANQNGPVKVAYAQSAAFRHVSSQTEREALRVLYVGWTRACDRLVLAAEQGKLLDGLLGTLVRIDLALLRDTDSTTSDLVDTTWAGHRFELRVSPFQPAPPGIAPPKPENVRVGRISVERAPATLPPSSSPPRPARLGEPVRLGPPVRMRRTVDSDVLGTALHGFFAADDVKRATKARLEMATGLLERHGVMGALEPADLLELAERLWRWVEEKFGQDSVVCAEWPLGVRLDTGTLVLGTSDLIIENPNTMAVIDHKSFGLATATSKAEVLAGQLGCYADAAMQARPGKPISRWVHLPFEGVVVEIL